MAKYYKILFLFLSFSALAYPQQQNIQFTHLTTKDGLSSNRVNAIIKDSRGFMWFATNNGLNRYDGYNFKIYKYDPQDSNSISGNYITSLCEDRYGNIWIGTRTNGFNQFDRKKNKFSRYKFDTQSYAPKAVNSVSLIYEDSSDSTHVLLILTAVRLS